MKCSCCERPALASVKGGKVKSIKDHDLCQRCFRDQLNRNRAARLAGMLSVLVLLVGCVGPKSLAHDDALPQLEAAPPGDSWKHADEAEWPYRCSALKVTAIDGPTKVMGYYMPVRCVAELSEYPGSVLENGRCVVGCQRPGDGDQVCFTEDCAQTVGPTATK